MITLNQGRKISAYFIVFQPPKSEIPLDEDISCINPQNNQVIKATCVDRFTMMWAGIPDSFTLLHYGMLARDFRSNLEEKYPEFKNEIGVRFLMLKQII